MSADRQQRSQFQNPLTAPVQAKFQQGYASQPLAAQHTAGEANQDYAGACYKRATALKDLRRFDEALAGFDEAIALQPAYAEAYNGRGIVLANLNCLDDAVASFAKAIALKPDYAEAYNNFGIALQDLNRLDHALDSFDKAIALKPDNAWAYNNRGVLLQHLNRFGDALVNFDRAIALKPDYAEAYYNRGMVLQDLSRPQDAIGSFDTAIALKPAYAEAYNNRAVVLWELRRLDEALAGFDRAIALRPDFAEACSNQAYCLLQGGHYEQGWRLHEWRKKLEKPHGNRSFPQPLWLGQEDISNSTLFIHWEQGFGDTIQFCRYGKLLNASGASVVMSVQDPLYRLLKQSSSGIEIISQGDVPAAFDYHCPMLSLPLALGTTLRTVPSEQRYIVADEQRREDWDIRLPPRTKPRIGIAWSGSAKHKNDHKRSIDIATLEPILSRDAHWISLQKELRPRDLAFLQEYSQIISCADELKDFFDTAALIDCLDLIITVDTSVAHLAGAMGKPVWILLPFNPDWRWLLDRDDSPWYPSARLFRQDDIGSWDSVIAQVRTELDHVIQTGVVPKLRADAPRGT